MRLLFKTFLAGVGSVLSFGWAKRKINYPFPYPGRAMTDDWERIGRDIGVAISKMERGNEKT